MTTQSTAPAVPSMWRAMLIIVVLFGGVVALTVLVPLGAAVPLALVLGAFALAVVFGSVWHGLFVVVGAIMLAPIPFSAHLGGATLSIGRVLMYGLAVGWMAQLRWRERAIRPRPTPLDPFLVFVLVTLVASTIFNLPRLSQSQVAGALRKDALFGVDFFLLFWVAASAIRDGERALRLLRFFTGVVVVTAALGIVERQTGKNVFEYLRPIVPNQVGAYIHALAKSAVLTRGALSRVHSTFEQPLIFALVLLMGLPLAMVFAVTARERWSKRAWTGGAVLIGGALLLTASRGAYIIAGVTLATVLVAAPDRRTRGRIFIAGVAIVGLFLAQHDVRNTMVAFFHSTRRAGGTFEGSIQSRINAFDKPFLGYGPHTLSQDEINQLLPKSRGALVLDNAYLGHVGEAGTIGLVALLGLLFAAWLCAVRGFRRSQTLERKLVCLALLSVVQTWFLFGFFADVYQFNAPPRLFFVLLGALVVLRREALPAPRVVHPEEGAFDGVAGPGITATDGR